MVCYYLPINWCISKLYPNCNVSAPTKRNLTFDNLGDNIASFASSYWNLKGLSQRMLLHFLQLRKLASKLVHSKHFADRWCCHQSTWGELSQNLFVEITHDCMLRLYICLFIVHITHFQLHVSTLLQLKQPMELVEVMKTAIGYYFS